jgi:methylenetetrahydrofolate reductase (NADPH)
LIDLQFLGVDNVLALRGDPVKTEASFTPKAGGSAYAVDLVEQLMELNKGQYMMDDVSLEPTDFCVGVAGYPEKHFESMNLATDMQHLKEKVDAGAEYIVTQMFFDNEKYFTFVKKCREIGINCPIIPGIKPITTLKHITFLPKFFNIDFPEALSKELLKCKSNAGVKQVGIEWGIEQSKGLRDNGTPCLHYYTMGKSEVVKKIASEVF